MKFVSILTAAALLLVGSSAAEVPGLEVKGPYASVKTNKDGSREYFSRTRDMRTITKQTKGADGTLRLTTVYRLSPQGNPLTCDIFDGKGTRLFKSRYGYDPKPGLTYGKLVEEQMFDARAKRTDTEGREIPVRRFLYTYDAQGNRNAPISITTIPGKTAQEVFGPSALEFDPFDGRPPADNRPANPRAKPLGGN
ncbi:MAG: hypothetical protein EAZ65_06985 [Verrucomicrobia bacterium]|nr:MAG: hypothetical protein EAZ84_07305 [Verrucomicrobiota bacterium]TAE87352.1 MAG: hypothetical protein EAZ82_07965 [Verrucomicrobiota bacterium]TAF25207.1 MAG: hypothetical protein EAZ71_08190 [Verrucomicrobiota bacterium]TAF40853.1 MAG: hypothetical protein EAZ65_06985 [Verrucomicrobiota bacterium]